MNKVDVERAEFSVQRKTLSQNRVSVKRSCVPMEQTVDIMLAKPFEHEITRKTHRYKERFVERVIEKPIFIERIVERPREVEVVREIPKETVREEIRTVEKIREEEVYFEAIIEQQVEVIVEREVRVPVEKIIEIPLEIRIPKIRVVEKIVEEFEDVEYETIEYDHQSPPE